MKKRDFIKNIFSISVFGFSAKLFARPVEIDYEKWVRSFPILNKDGNLAKKCVLPDYTNSIGLCLMDWGSEENPEAWKLFHTFYTRHCGGYHIALIIPKYGKDIVYLDENGKRQIGFYFVLDY